jgi:hypothetical protein
VVRWVFWEVMMEARWDCGVGRGVVVDDLVLVEDEEDLDFDVDLALVLDLVEVDGWLGEGMIRAI